MSVYSLVSPYYTKEYYVLAYGETIYLIESQSQWNVPNEVAARVVLPLKVKDKKRGRPKTSRFPSAREFRKQKNHCDKFEGKESIHRRACLIYLLFGLCGCYLITIKLYFLFFINLLYLCFSTIIYFYSQYS